MTKSGIRKYFSPDSPVNMIDSRVYSRKSNYKGLLDDNERSPNPVQDSNTVHQQQQQQQQHSNHPKQNYTESAQMESSAELKYNKRLKTLIDNETNGNYVSQGYRHEEPKTQMSNDHLETTQVVVQMGQQSTQNEHNQHCYEQNLNYTLSADEQNFIYPDKSECERHFSNHKDMNNELNATAAYNNMILQDNQRIISNDNNLLVAGQTNDVNHLAQHFNDRLQTQTIARSYNPQCANKLIENAKSLLATYQQCEQSFGKSYQHNEHE